MVRISVLILRSPIQLPSQVAKKPLIHDVTEFDLVCAGDVRVRQMSQIKMHGRRLERYPLCVLLLFLSVLSEVYNNHFASIYNISRFCKMYFHVLGDGLTGSMVRI